MTRSASPEPVVDSSAGFTSSPCLEDLLGGIRHELDAVEDHLFRWSESANPTISAGGGHSKLCVDHEGHNLARWLAERGVAAFVLKYRLSREKDSTYTLEGHAVGDMQRALRLVRSRAKEWNIDPQKVGALGFSAGGELAFMAAMQPGNANAIAADEIDKQSGRPDFQCLIYPGKSSRIAVDKDMPQAFIVCGYGDRQDISHGMAEVYLKFKDAGVPAELHIYAAAGHGFGVRDSSQGAVARWPARLEEWLADKVVRRPAKS